MTSPAPEKDTAPETWAVFVSAEEFLRLAEANPSQVQIYWAACENPVVIGIPTTTRIRPEDITRIQHKLQCVRSPGGSVRRWLLNG